MDKSSSFHKISKRSAVMSPYTRVVSLMPPAALDLIQPPEQISTSTFACLVFPQTKTSLHTSKKQLINPSDSALHVVFFALLITPPADL